MKGLYLMNEGSTIVYIRAYTLPEGIRLKVMANRRLVGSVLMEPSKWVDISRSLGKIRLGSGILMLDLEASRTWVPDEVLGNGDRREMGVAVERIWVGEG